MQAARKYVALCFVLHHFGHDKATSVEPKHGQAVHKRTDTPVTVCIFAGNSKLSDMEIVTIERKTFEEMKEKFNRFSEHLQQLCSRYRPPEKMNWLDNADVCEKLNVSKRTLQSVP